MNHDETTSVPQRADNPPGGRAEAVLRRAGVVEHQPPPHVWDGVVQQLRSDRPLRLVGATSGRSDGAPRGRWSGGVSRLLAAAAVGAMLTWAGLELVQREAPGQTLASGELAPLTAAGAEGSAQVVQVDGQQRLRVELTERPDAEDGYLEVWLLRPDVTGMVTLGVLEGEDGEFLLPPGLDLEEYAVVDISREHLDGDPGHGGDSLVRGQVG